MFAIKISVLRVHGLTRRICIQIKQQESNKTENDTFEITRPRFPARKQKKPAYRLCPLSLRRVSFEVGRNDKGRKVKECRIRVLTL